MNKKFFLAILLSGLIGCTPEPHVQIKFCETPDTLGNCLGEQNEFPLGKIYVSCESVTPFEAKKLTGTVYEIREGEKIFLGSKDFVLEPEDQKVTHSIPFDEFGERGFGEFLVEFVNENNVLLAEKSIFIKR